MYDLDLSFSILPGWVINDIGEIGCSASGKDESAKSKEIQDCLRCRYG